MSSEYCVDICGDLFSSMNAEGEVPSVAMNCSFRDRNSTFMFMSDQNKVLIVGVLLRPHNCIRRIHESSADSKYCYSKDCCE